MSAAVPSASAAARKLARAARLAPRSGADLVGPPHPISNIRPLLLTGSAFEPQHHLPPAASTSSNAGSSGSGAAAVGGMPHPYSLAEFGGPSQLRLGQAPSSSFSAAPSALGRYSERLLDQLEAAELRHRLARARAEALTQRFWSDNNMRFNTAQAEYESESNLARAAEKVQAPPPPPSAAALRVRRGGGKTKPTRSAAEDDALSPFYASWLAANAARHRAYNSLLWQHTLRDLGPAAHYQVLRAWTRLVCKVDMWRSSR